jgi:hypothetical protein
MSVCVCVCVCVCYHAVAIFHENRIFYAPYYMAMWPVPLYRILQIIS